MALFTIEIIISVFFLFDTSFKNLNQESNQKFVLILGHIYRFFWKPNQLKEIELNQTDFFFFFGNLFDSVRKLNFASIILRKKKVLSSIYVQNS